jgi:hypothetical protein
MQKKGPFLGKKDKSRFPLPAFAAFAALPAIVVLRGSLHNGDYIDSARSIDFAS